MDDAAWEAARWRGPLEAARAEADDLGDLLREQHEKAGKAEVLARRAATVLQVFGRSAPCMVQLADALSDYDDCG